MITRLFLATITLAMLAGCGDASGKRRQASGNVGGVGLVGADTSTAAPATTNQATTNQPVGNQATATQPAAGQPAAAMPGAGTLPNPNPSPNVAGLPGVNVPLPGQPQPGQQPAAQPGTTTEKAQAGVTGRGNYGPGLITTPISAYFQVQEQLVFQQVTHAMKLYEAEHGQKPKTEEEFMKNVIQANHLKLPTLPEGSKYKYDPKTGELLVEHPQ
jgi:hypothetical protein